MQKPPKIQFERVIERLGLFLGKFLGILILGQDDDCGWLSEFFGRKKLSLPPHFFSATGRLTLYTALTQNKEITYDEGKGAC